MTWMQYWQQYVVSQLGLGQAVNVNDLIGIEEVFDSIVLHKGKYVLILEVMPLNFSLRNAEEKQQIIDCFAELLRVIKAPIQISSLAQKADIREHLNFMLDIGSNSTDERLQDLIIDYLSFAHRTLTNGAVKRRFFLSIPYLVPVGMKVNCQDAMQILREKANQATQILRKAGNVVKMLDQVELLRTIGEIMQNPEQITSFEPHNVNESLPIAIDDLQPQHIRVYGQQGQEMLVAMYQIKEYPLSVEAAWLTSIINAGEGISISLSAHPENKLTAQRTLTANMGFTGAKLLSGQSSADADVQRGALDDAYYMRKSLSEGEDLWYMHILIRVTAGDQESLKQRCNLVETLLVGQGMTLERLDYQHCEAWVSSLPFATVSEPLLKQARRNVLTTGLAASYPFDAYELSDPSGVMLGLNDHNGSAVILDIFNTSLYPNANLLLLGTSGSGKTFTTQILATRIRLQEIPIFYICPLKGHEYKPACDYIGGLYLKLAPGSKQTINILELRWEAKTIYEESLLAGKLQKLRTFFSLMLPYISFAEQQLFDEALLETYARFGITMDNQSLKRGMTMPALGDVYETLASYPELKDIRRQLKPYVQGSLSFLNGQTNVDLQSKYIVCDVSSDALPAEAISLVMLLILDIYWDLIRRDPTQKKCLIIDEAWRLIGAGGNEQTAAYVLEIFKIIRGYGGSAIAATQDIGDLFALKNGVFGRALLHNTALKLLLRTEGYEGKIVQEMLGLTNAELQHLSYQERGHGLLFAGAMRLPIGIVPSPKEHELITTDRSEIAYLRKEGLR